tara:strand:- start:1850 stop:2452 length:603 start_codon:yes stop_codon:yes gene_type:complete
MTERTASINNFIGIYDGYILEQDCQNAIDFFNGQQKINKTFTREASEKASSMIKKDSQYFASGANYEVWLKTLKPLMFNFDMALKHYETNTGIKEAYGITDFSYTNIKIQQTLPTEGYHVWHLEHGSGLDNCARALAYTIYLNDVDEGGETEFLNFSKRVSPKTGRIVIWPAGFPYVHRGNPPLNKAKYIITSWMNLLNY